MTRAKQDLESRVPPPDLLPFQLVKLVKPPTGERWLHEIKFDGYRLQARVVGGEASFQTRNGHRLDRLLPCLGRRQEGLAFNVGIGAVMPP